MKLGRVTKLDQKNTTTVIKLDDNTVSSNYCVLVNVLIYGQFRAIGKLDYGFMVYSS